MNLNNIGNQNILN